MVERRIKPALLVMTAATASLSCLALPTVRSIIAALPESPSGATSCSGLRSMTQSTHAQLGDIAAEVACTYLRKLGASQRAAVPAGQDESRDRGAPKQPAGSDKQKEL